MNQLRTISERSGSREARPVEDNERQEVQNKHPVPLRSVGRKGRMPLSQEQRKVLFWTQIKRGNNDECWNWEGASNREGYGRFRWNGKPKLAHRISYLLHHGEDPYPLDVLHHCDNPKCVNPNHLFLGTDKDNVRDMIEKGRNNPVFGERSPRATLSNDEVLDIKKHITIFTTLLSEKFSVNRMVITNILRERAWVKVK